ncbi:hypothetical protein GCM10020254_78570 [Streptomyces goshikiensis]
MNAARTQTGPAARRGPRPGAVLAALAAAQFTVMLATSIVNVALPQIRAGAGLSDGGTTWVVNAYGLAFGALLLAGGRLADLFGRRRVLIAGLALFALASLAAGLATSAGVLIAARALQGLGAAAIAPAALAMAMDRFPSGPGRGRALGVWGRSPVPAEPAASCWAVCSPRRGAGPGSSTRSRSDRRSSRRPWPSSYRGTPGSGPGGSTCWAPPPSPSP